MFKPIRAIAAVFALMASTLTTFAAAQAGCLYDYDAYPAYFVYPPPYIVTDDRAPTYYYGGFYGPRVAFAPRLHRTHYGYVVRYQNVPRY